MSVIRYHLVLAVIVGYFSAGSVFAQKTVLTDLKDFYPEDIQFAGFKVSASTNLQIDVAVLQPRRSDRDILFSYAWILNSDTREKVWEVFDADPQDREGESLIFREERPFPPGTYEVYYSTYPVYDRWGDEHVHFDGFISGLFRVIFDHDRNYRYFAEDYEDLYFKVSGNGTPMTSEEISGHQQQIKDKALLSISPERDESYVLKEIKVNEPVNLRVYALGEARPDVEYDFGWITDARTRERVWQFTYRHSEHAGGASKNRVIDTNIELDPGVYEVVYLTDDSHSYREWNTAAPFDPEFWGLTIWPSESSGKNAVSVVNPGDDKIWGEVVKFEKARDNDYFAEGFSIAQPMDMHILALGEGRDGEMFDYAWIVNAKTRSKVWVMDYYDTDPAGGAEKNRMFDGVVKLDAGNYIVYYVTDGSHAYRSWNAGKPYDPKAWGVSVSAPAEMVVAGIVKPYNEEEDPSVLARIVRVGDHARKKEKFVIDKDQYVHIYALGEGDRDEMYDFAWIEEARTGKVIWEMTYRKTERAGGARKNRLYDDRILIPAGEYYAVYETDDSHAFGDWNDNPPYDQINYGITISYAEK